MNLTDMPDDVLIRLLNTAAAPDVARAKRLNKRFNQIVETFNLGKPEVKEFSVESRISATSPTKIGRLRLGGSSGAAKRRVVVTMRRDRGVKRVERLEDPSCSNSSNMFVQENIKKVILQDRLSFDGVILDEDFYKMLTLKKDTLRNVTTVSLSLCHLRLSPSQFIDFLTQMTVKHLYIDFCTFDSSLISDKVMMSLGHLETLQIQSRFPCFFQDLTDRSLIHWTTESNIPPTIQLRNGCASRMTAEGVRMMMTKALSNPTPTASNIDWDFGLLLDPTQSDSVLLSFVMCPGLDVKISDAFRSRRISLSREKFALQFFIPAPFPAGPLSAAA